MTATAERVVTYLLVEDNDAHAEIVEQCFEYVKPSSRIRRVSKGADCLTYLAGEEPFADRSQHPFPDVVLLDIHMPGVLDGFQTLKAIRSDPRHRSLMVMMLTTSERDLDVNCAYDLGANGYIVKSDDTEEMIEKLTQLQHSFESCVRLPETRREDDTGSRQDVEVQAPPDDVEPLMQSDQDAAFDLLLSAYLNDRDDMLRLLKVLERVSITRFASLVCRFCIEQRHLFAGSRDVDWTFLRSVVMKMLPRSVPPEKMAGVVAGIAAALEGNEATDADDPSWHAWQGFCDAYLNQHWHALPRLAEKAESERPRAGRNWTGAVIGVLGILLTAAVAFCLWCITNL